MAQVESIIAQKSSSTNDNVELPLISRGLPDDIVLCILARLPWAVQACFRCVCRTWNRVLLQSRRPFLFVWVDSRLVLLDPLSLRCKSLPPIPERLHLTHQWPKAACATSGYIVFGNFPHEGRSRFSLLNLQTMQYCENPLPNREDRLLGHNFSAVIVGGYVYIIKGWRRETSSHRVHRLKLQGDMASTMWECIPDMHELRYNPAVLVLEGGVWVLGGTSDDGQYVHSGEVWDSSLETWTLIPELWPPHLFGTSPLYPYAKAVVASQGKIYAISSRTEAVVYYEHAIRAWRNLCPLASILPHPLRNVYIYNIFAVGNELWVTRGDYLIDHVVMLTHTPTALHISPVVHDGSRWRSRLLPFGRSF